MFPGERLNFNRSEAVNANYEPFTKSLLREIARCMGITYEQLTGDYVGATYSSLRMSIADMWIINVYRRAMIPARFYQTVFEAWLEEDIERGLTPFPGGVDNYLIERSRVARADWRGPPRPSADELKTAKAMQIVQNEGWAPREQMAAEYGNDWFDVDEQQAVERENRDRLGLLPPEPVPAGGGPNGTASPGPKTPPSPGAGTDAKLVGAIQADDHDEVKSILEIDYGYQLSE
jgi:lambda family phage portal protein